MRYEKWKDTRYWAVYDETNNLRNICLYKKGAIALIRDVYELRGYSESKIQDRLAEIEKEYYQTRQKQKSENAETTENKKRAGYKYKYRA